MSAVSFEKHKEYLRLDEVAHFLNLDSRTVRNLIARGTLKATAIAPRVTRVASDDLIRFAQRGLRGSPQWPVRVRLSERLLRPERLAAMLGVARDTVVRWAEEEKIPVIDVCQGRRATIRIIGSWAALFVPAHGERGRNRAELERRV